MGDIEAQIAQSSSGTYRGADINIAADRCAAAKFYLVPLDPGLAALALNVDTGGCAAHDPVVPNFDNVMWPCLEHDAPRFEVVKIAVFDDQV